MHSNTTMGQLWSLLPEELAPLLASRGVRTSPESVFTQLQRASLWAVGPQGLLPVLGKHTQFLLEEEAPFLPEIVSKHTANDGATKVVLKTYDGHLIEAVHMPRAVKNPRVTLCISSQVGCAMGCTFCATASMGLLRHLTAGEIVGQVLQLMVHLGPVSGHQLNIVFMGMGEPLHNLSHVAKAIEILCHTKGVGMSPQRITVSTSGLVPKIYELGKLPVRPLLAVSLNATTDEKRSGIMPVNKTHNLVTLKQAILDFPRRHREKVLIEYVLLKGENDTLEDAERLISFAQGFRHNINLIPLNEHEHTRFKSPHDDWVWQFAQKLMNARCLVTVRFNRAREVSGACGQLVQVTFIKR